MLVTIETLAVTNILDNKIVIAILIYSALALIVIPWLIEFVRSFAKPVKVIKHEVCFDNFSQPGKPEILVFMTFKSDITIGIEKTAIIDISRPIRGKVSSFIRFPVYLRLDADSKDDYIILEAGKPRKIFGHRDISMEKGKDATPDKVFNELANNINNELAYSITYSTDGKQRYIFHPSNKEKKRRKRELSTPL